MEPISRSSITRWQLGPALLVLLASAAWLVHAVFFDPGVPFLTRGDGPEWIAPYQPASTDAIRIDLADLPSYTFVASVSLEAEIPEAVVRLRAVGESELRINETLVWRSDPAESWKRVQQRPVRGLLRAGDNEIRVRVANARGPALLQLWLGERASDDAPIAATDLDWRAIAPDGRIVETVHARDSRPNPESFTVPSTGIALIDHGAVIGLLFALGIAAHAVLRRAIPTPALARAPEATLAAATAFWIAVYVAKSSQLPVMMGFDIPGHLAYLEFLLTRGELPLARDGWSMYHPPFGHALIAGLAALFDVGFQDAAARWLYRLPTFLAGLASVWATWFTARRLFGNDPLRTSLATAFAALLPMNLYMSAYVSNEPIHAALVSTSLCLACAVVGTPGRSPWRLVALTLALGLAILTKFTALLAVPLVAFFVALKIRLVDRASAARVLGTTAWIALGVAIVGGWFYLRSWHLQGRPIVGNWDLPGNVGWWEQPGFHTIDYYTRFGQALSHPFFAGFSSFWDGVYSTFWGDGLASGMVRLATRHDAWNWDFMTAAYWLAFPATLLLGVGALRALRFGVSHPDPGQRLGMSLLLGFVYTACFALLAITFQLPYYAQAKAFYVLSAIVPISILAALGLSWPLEQLPRGTAGVRWIYCGWLGTLFGSIAITFLG